MMHMNKYLVIDSRMSEESKNKLILMRYHLIEIPEIACLEKPISAHPDMSVLSTKERLFVSSDVYRLFTFTDAFEVERNHFYVDLLEYPLNISLNCAVVGKNIICNEKYTCKTVLEILKKLDYKIINVNQGYAKCSTCIVSDNAIITEDESIATECSKVGIDVLKISKGHVKLNGYDYGFIGGCSGLIESDLLVFNGCIEKHPDYKYIYDFCKKHGVCVLSLNNEPLYDVGSIVRIH